MNSSKCWRSCCIIFLFTFSRKTNKILQGPSRDPIKYFMQLTWALTALDNIYQHLNQEKWIQIWWQPQKTTKIFFLDENIHFWAGHKFTTSSASKSKGLICSAADFITALTDWTCENCCPRFAFLTSLSAQGAGGRGPADASISAHLWRLPAEHRRQVLPEGHWAVLARGLPELRPVWLQTRGGGAPPLLQAGKKAVSERLPQVGVWSRISGFVFLWSFSSSRCSCWSRPQAVWPGRSLRFLWEEDQSVWDDDARSGQSLPPGVLQMCSLSEALLRGRPLPAHQLRHRVWAGHLWVDQTQQQQHRLANLASSWLWKGRSDCFKGLPVACACWWWLHQQ